MQKLLICVCAALLMGGNAFADIETSPTSDWTLPKDQISAVLLANWSSDDLTFIYRVCLTGGPAMRVSTREVQGQPVLLAKGQCVDVVTQGSIRLTRADATGQDAASGTYRFIHATRNRST